MLLHNDHYFLIINNEGIKEIINKYKKNEE